MSKLRSVSTAVWSDVWFEDLTPAQKLLWLFLITNEKTNMLGIYEVSIKKISFETGVNKSDVEKALKQFEKDGRVKYQSNHVILTKFLKHQNFNTNMKKSAIDVYNNLPKELKKNSLTLDKSKPLESFETLSNHLGIVRKVEVEYEEEVKYELEEEPKEAVIYFPNDILLNEKYIEFLKFRKESKKPVLKSSLEANKKKLMKMAEENTNTAIEIIEQSIANGWQGFFELKTNQNNGGQHGSNQVKKIGSINIPSDYNPEVF